MDQVYGYIRLSKYDSESTGYGLEGQTDEVLRIFQRVKAIFPSVIFNQIIQDTDISAHRTKKTRNIFLRPGGAKMMNLVKPGDHIIFAHSDRSFRDWGECGIFYRDCTERGIHVHFTDLPIVEDPWTNSTLLGVRAAFAQDQSDAMSRRTKLGLAVAYRNLPKHYPLKLKVKTLLPDGRHTWMPDKNVFVLTRYVQILRRCDCLSFKLISDRLERLLAAREGREVLPHEKRTYRETAVRGLYEFALQIPTNAAYTAEVNLNTLSKPALKAIREKESPLPAPKPLDPKKAAEVINRAAERLAKQQEKLERSKQRRQRP